MTKRNAAAAKASTYAFGDNRWRLSVDPATCAAELKRIEIRDGGIAPDRVVEEARDPDAVLHPIFDWDDQRAAEAHRRDQARGLIRSIMVRREGRSLMNAFFHIRTQAQDAETGRTVTIQHYRSYENIVSEPPLLGQVISDFRKRLSSLQESVVQLEQLALSRDLPPEKIDQITQCLTALMMAGEAIHGVQ